MPLLTHTDKGQEDVAFVKKRSGYVIYETQEKVIPPVRVPGVLNPGLPCCRLTCVVRCFVVLSAQHWITKISKTPSFRRQLASALSRYQWL